MDWWIDGRVDRCIDRCVDLDRYVCFTWRASYKGFRNIDR